ncbi:hypothetical protein ACFC26_21780 [Kitasatospora purpeofusca]|uniref:GP88 family protein n=1 Tax=Kitasatospora purpeofusca TaxID=67352 RepID=UPI0035DE9347
MPEADAQLELFDAPPAKPKPRLLGDSNSDLNRDGTTIYTWSLPANWTFRRTDGSVGNTCPEAGVCARLCYATERTSSYRRLPNVLASHRQNLAMVLETPREWEQWMIEELRHPRFHGAVVRIHDAGDFFDDEYTEAWLRIMRSAPHVRFYAYTKAVDRFARIVAPVKPDNFKYTLSLGGKEDVMIDLTTQRHADVFPTTEALEAAGYVDQAASDLLAVAADVVRVGMAVNQNATIRKRLGSHAFSAHQRKRDARRAAKELIDFPAEQEE